MSGNVPDSPRPGYKRQWLRCRQCFRMQFYDYVPYSLSNPIMTTICGHGATQRDLGCDGITEHQALLSLVEWVA